MNTLRQTVHATLAAPCLLASAAFAALDAPAALDSVAATFGQGKVSLNVRARYEGVQQSGLQDADAGTLRTRLGFTTAPINGWRQNAQTFDSVTLTNKTVDQLSVTYGYLHQINRVFGDRHAQGDWEGNSHVLNASYTGLPVGTLTAYAYLLDFDNAAPNSCATYGLSLAGTLALGKKLKLSYRAEYAGQSDYGSSPLDYSADFYHGELGLVAQRVLIAVGDEVLGTDNNVGFKTPLATLHAFNGWSDVFLATPAGGLRDTYGKAGATLPGGISLLAFHHHFATDTGIALGQEWDLQLTRKLGKYLTGLVKFAKFDRDGTILPDVTKLWLQAEFNY